MSRLTTPIILVVAYFLIYAQTSFSGISFFRARIDLLPVLMAYAALRVSWRGVTMLAVFGGLAVDSLSANPFGLSVLPLFLIGMLLHEYRQSILSENLYAQSILGGAVCLASQLGGLGLLILMGEEPLIAWGSVWQIGWNAAFGAACAPLIFWAFGKIEDKLNYQTLPETTLRKNRQIKRGRN